MVGSTTNWKTIMTKPTESSAILESELSNVIDSQTLDSISNAPDRSAKTAWNRKMDNMVKLLAKLSPIEQDIIRLQGQKMPIFDEVQQLRETMVSECIHPQQYLTRVDGVVLCKFCQRRISTAKL